MCLEGSHREVKAGCWQREKQDEKHRSSLGSVWSASGFKARVINSNKKKWSFGEVLQGFYVRLHKGSLWEAGEIITRAAGKAISRIYICSCFGGLLSPSCTYMQVKDPTGCLAKQNACGDSNTLEQHN